MPSDTPRIRELLAGFFRGKPVLKAELFGSYARGEAGPESDVLLRPSVEAMKNPKARDLILNTAITVYVA